MKVGLFIPAYRSTVHPMVWRQGLLEGITCERAGVDLVPAWQDCNGVDLARNRAMSQALAGGFDYLLMQDQDTWSPRPVVLQMLGVAEEHGATIVAAAYPLRRRGAEISVLPFRAGEVYEGQLAGTGLMLISLAKLREIGLGALDQGTPWFYRTFDDARGTKLGVGGDVRFCQTVRLHGGSLWIDARIETVHAELDTDRLHYIPGPGANGHGDTDRVGGDLGAQAKARGATDRLGGEGQVHASLP